MQVRKAASAAIVLAIALVAPFQAAAQEASPWIHVQVIEEGDEDGGETVHVNVPLSLARVALQVAPQEMKQKLTEKLSEKDIKLSDVRALWNELKNAGDAEFVTVESEKESVKVARAGDKIQVFVRERGDDEGDEGGEQVQVDIPIAVVDALLSGEGEELNLEAAVARLGDQRGDIVQVRDGGSRVRVWIDERS